MSSKSRPKHILVRSDDRLRSLAELARSTGCIAFDTEFMRERTYRAKLCLVQLAAAGDIYIVDPLDEVDLAPVAELIADPELEVVVHAGRQDFEIFYERFGAVPARPFDVQIAAGFAGLGSSLPYGRLVHATTGARLAKSESYTDWCRRPLTEAQLRYAGDDVRYLLQAADDVKQRLERHGRMRWALDEMAELCDASAYEVDTAEAWRRIPGRGSLSGRQLAVLRELARWREDAAARRDLPRGWVVKDQSLIEIARRSPSDVAALRSIRGLSAKEAERSGKHILEAVRRGREAPPIDIPRGPGRPAQIRARATAGLADALLRARCEEAGVAPELVATRADLESLLTALFADGSAPPGHRLLQGWRRELFGDDLVSLAQGRVALRAVEGSPYIEEVPLG